MKETKKDSNEFDLYYTKTRKDWNEGLNTEFNSTHYCYNKAVEVAKKLAKNNYLVEINIVSEPSKFVVISKNYKLIEQ